MDPETHQPVARLAPKQWHRYDHGGPQARVHPAITPCNVPTSEGPVGEPRNNQQMSSDQNPGLFGVYKESYYPVI